MKNQRLSGFQKPGISKNLFREMMVEQDFSIGILMRRHEVKIIFGQR
jgi:hypothetical protein